MKNSGLLRRFGAILYDALLIIALFALVTLFFIARRGGESVEPNTLTYQLVLLAVSFLFFVWFWQRSGSTLGMLAWGLRVETAEGAPPNFAKASIRFFAAMLSWGAVGLGFFWQLWDKDKLTWHDRISGTRLRHYPKPAKSAKS